MKTYLVKRTAEVNFIVQANSELEASKKVTDKNSHALQVRVVSRPHLDTVIEVSDVVDLMVSDHVIPHIPKSGKINS